MGAGYTRQSAAEIQTGEIVEASPLNAEFNQLQNAFDGTTGHTHDGTVGEGPKISLTSSVSGVLPVVNGGTGGINKTNATTAPTANDDASDGYTEGSIWVDVTGDIIYLCVDSTPTAAIWQRYTLYDAGLTSIAGLTTSADKMIYTTASDVYATTDLTSYARTLLDDANVSAAQTTLGISTYVKTLLDDADAATARTTLGLGTISTQASSSVSISGGTISGVTLSSSNATITGGSITGITDLAIADGGTGASTAANARTNLGLAIGTDVQAQDAELSAIAGLASAADRLPYFTGSGTAALATFTSFARTVVDDSTATAARTTLGIETIYAGKSGNYTALATDNYGVLRFTASATLSLTAAATLTANWNLSVFADGGDVTIDPNASETINGATTLLVPNGSFAYIICTGTVFFAFVSAGQNTSKWRSRFIGEIVYANTALTGAEVPPSSLTDTVWIELTSGLTGVGAFNENKLTSESVTGSAPLVLASAVINYSASPMNGQTVRLLNTEGRILRPSTSPNTSQNDQFQGFRLGASGSTPLTLALLQVTGGSTPTPFTTGSDYFVPVSDGTNGTPRTGTETRPKNLGVTAYMRIA